MLVVTSAPRSGSSVCLQTMMHLGVPMASPAFLPEHAGIVEFNPGGYYETPYEFGVCDDRYKGMAVKMFGYQLYDTDKKYISKLIWVVRDREEAIKSYEKLRPRLKHWWVSGEKVFDANIALIKECVDADTLIVKLEDIKQRPEEFISRLIKHLNITPTDAQFMKAKQNIV